MPKIADANLNRGPMKEDPTPDASEKRKGKKRRLDNPVNPEATTGPAGSTIAAGGSIETITGAVDPTGGAAPASDTAGVSVNRYLN